MCDIKNHKPYLDIKYEELQNLNIFQSDKEEDNAEFIVTNPDLLDLEMEDRDIVSNALIVSAISDNLILPNYVFWNMFTVEWGSTAPVQFRNTTYITMQIRRNNELPPKLFQIFLSGGAGVGESILVIAITKYLEFWDI